MSNLFYRLIMSTNKPKPDFINPIDPDKVAKNPGLLPYGHTVGAPAIRPEDIGKKKSRALSAMQEQTDMQLMQIKEQIDLLARQAKAIQDRIEVSNKIYDAIMGFEPLIGHTYHLYFTKEETYKLLMLSPNEWDCVKKNLEFTASVKMLGDHTWEIIS